LVTDDDQPDEIDWDDEFADDPDWQAMTPAQRQRLLSFAEQAIEKKIFCVYGDEEPAVPDSTWPCAQYLDQCKAKCCTFIFALTKDEVEVGLVQYNDKRPFFIARDAHDGYCPHLDRDSYQCTVYDNRPLRCRRYDCENDPAVWPELAKNA